MNKKLCTKCGRTRLLKSFNKNSSRKDGLQTKCRDCDRNRARKYFLVNRDAQLPNIRKNKLKRQIRNTEFINSFLLTHPCIDCGNPDLRVLEFDHQRDKFKNVGTLVSGGWSLEIVKNEVEKCVVRCANCHRIKTAKDFNYNGYLAETD